MASATLTGLADLDRALQEIRSAATQRNVLQRVANAALMPMRDTARELAPDDPHTGAPDLRTSIEVSPTRSKIYHPLVGDGGPASVQAFMGPTKQGYPEAMPQEFGSKPHDIVPKKAGQLMFDEDGKRIAAPIVHHPGNPPHPFMRPAFEQHKEAAVGIVRDKLRAEIDKAVARQVRKDARVAGGS